MPGRARAAARGAHAGSSASWPTRRRSSRWAAARAATAPTACARRRRQAHGARRRRASTCKDLKSLVDEGKKQLGSGVVAIVGVTDEGKAGIVVGVTDDLDARFQRRRPRAQGRRSARRQGRRRPPRHGAGRRPGRRQGGRRARCRSRRRSAADRLESGTRPSQGSSPKRWNFHGASAFHELVA